MGDKVVVGDEWLPGRYVVSDEDIFRFVKESLAPNWHAASTCEMGRKGDGMAVVVVVVNSEARIFGTEGG